METVLVGATLALLTWQIAKQYVPAWLPPVVLRVAAVLVVACALTALVCAVPRSTLAALGSLWLAVGTLSFAVRRWLAQSKERDARRAALHAARTQVRRRAPPPGPTPTTPSATTGGTP